MWFSVSANEQAGILSGVRKALTQRHWVLASVDYRLRWSAQRIC